MLLRKWFLIFLLTALPVSGLCNSDVECLVPNPIRAVVSKDLTEYMNVLEDGGFENGSQEVRVAPDFVPAEDELITIQRSASAARTGNFGYHVSAGIGEKGEFSVKALLDKAEENRFGFWVKSVSGNARLRMVISYENTASLAGQPVLGNYVDVGSDWQRIIFSDTKTDNFDVAWVGLMIEENTDIYIDDVSVSVPVWKMADPPAPSAVVGGIAVPATPAAPVLFTFVIHIEDPQILLTDRAFFTRKTVIFEELAKIFHKHGGFLTIQPEIEWAKGAAAFDPDALKRLADLYHVKYSTHTHGPACKDDGGNLCGSAACSVLANPDRTLTETDVVDYIDERIRYIETMSGTTVSDHNGNFDLINKDKLAAIGVKTLSAYKKKSTQQSYDYLITNPWRPANADAETNVDAFLVHDPDQPLIYLPGVGHNITRQHSRVEEKFKRIAGQFIRYADADRVSTMLLVCHEGAFSSKTGLPNDEYIIVDEQTWQVSLSDEFKTHLACWDDMMTRSIDPLVDAGYLQWAGTADMAAAYASWEETCGEEDRAAAVHTFRIPCQSAGEEGIFARLVLPSGERFPDSGAPVVVHVPGGTGGAGLNSAIGKLTDHGMIDLTFNFPGSGYKDEKSGGIYDFRGPDSLTTLRDVTLFAMGKQADTQSRYISDICSPIRPLVANVGLISYSNGGNAALTVSGLHGEDLAGLAWLVNWESPVGDGMPTAEAGARGESFNPETNPAYDPDTGEFDLTTLRYDTAVSVNQHYTSTVKDDLYGGLYFDINNSGTLDQGTDFVPFPMMLETQNSTRAYYSVRLTEYAFDNNLYPEYLPGHLTALSDTRNFWLYRNGEYWMDELVDCHPDLMFMIIASEEDHVQTAADHPHILIQYNGLLAEGVSFARLNPDAAYLEYITEDVSGAADNDAYETFDHQSILRALEPGGENAVSKSALIAAAACEMTDRVFYNNTDRQTDPETVSEPSEKNGGGSGGGGCFISLLAKSVDN